MFGQVGAQTTIKSVEFDLPLYSGISTRQQLITKNEDLFITKSWMTVKEPISVWSENNFTVQGILEHLNVTKDLSDYLWHITRYIYIIEYSSTSGSGLLDRMSFVWHNITNINISCLA